MKMAFAGKKVLGVFAVIMLVVVMSVMLVGCGRNNGNGGDDPDNENGNGQAWYLGEWFTQRIVLGEGSDAVTITRAQMANSPLLGDFAQHELITQLVVTSSTITFTDIGGDTFGATFTLNNASTIHYTPVNTELPMGRIARDGDVIVLLDGINPQDARAFRIYMDRTDATPPTNIAGGTFVFDGGYLHEAMAINGTTIPAGAVSRATFLALLLPEGRTDSYIVSGNTITMIDQDGEATGMLVFTLDGENIRLTADGLPVMENMLIYRDGRIVVNMAFVLLGWEGQSESGVLYGFFTRQA